LPDHSPTLPFAKYHALGNDYVVVEEADWPPLDAPLVRRVCDRHFGIGADGILVRIAATSRHRLRIFNPDGSQAEKSGNGLRIFARYLWDHELAGSGPFKVETPGGEVTCIVHEGGGSVTVDMGRVTFERLNERLTVGGETLEYSAVSVGNPHCVIIRTRTSAEEARRLGPLIEAHADFPKRTNVQFLQILDRRNLKLEIWERGAGYTLASGTSGTAAAAVARRLGLVEGAVTVHMPGGPLDVEIDDRDFARLRGAVVRVAEGVLHRECLDDRRSAG
jgi:diaminopimelate epimerase